MAGNTPWRGRASPAATAAPPRATPLLLRPTEHQLVALTRLVPLPHLRKERAKQGNAITETQRTHSRMQACLHAKHTHP